MISFRAATLADLAALRPVLPGRYGRLMAFQILQWPCWCVDINGDPAALCGCAPCGTLTELWFSPARDFSTRKGSAAALRAVFIKTALFKPDDDLIVRIRDDNPTGQRMARLIGFEPTTEVMAVGRTWLRPAIKQQAAAGPNLPSQDFQVETE